MTFYVENDVEVDFEFNTEEVFSLVAKKVLETEGFEDEASVFLLLTDDEAIHEINYENRNIDKATDVLSFPNLDFDAPGDFSKALKNRILVTDPETDEIVLGDIIISVDHLKAQAKEYGHSVKREFAFLVAHSMLHLCGYDHMEDAEREIMEAKQENVLQILGITRDE